MFFNDSKGAVKLDKDDVNVTARANDDKDIRISLCFDELPDQIVIDATNETTLQGEYLLNEEGLLEVVKIYPNAGAAKVFIKALHPTNPECCDLLQKRDRDLRNQIDANHIACHDRTRNAVMRSSIWNLQKSKSVKMHKS